ncbi:GNAT family N-acetyltransferase [Flavisolibacter tropicus]|uniref:GCN5 family acetyltransferase n=1 Tax=Flavisolibacter tropicus TaxID=1492898 RepID=A0A172TTJ0_9BACT|nr:GNAT family N-acetyltransferase [Flavisolibacter tropicus]ANE50103.1 GCN5 family acetyltransferase [Flavisolibacter tropicus]
MITSLHISPATTDDIPNLVRLVNSAYRGDSAKKGWTHEADLISGTERIDVASIKQMLKKPSSVILKCTDDTNTIVGCVYLDKQADKLYLGMLTVSPDIQARGIGKRLLQAADEYAQQNQLHHIIMTVINVRKELIDWYNRNGYTDTGERQPFPTDGRFGLPQTQLEFVVLQKTISAAP